jgi:hypothetical protein
MRLFETKFNNANTSWKIQYCGSELEMFEQIAL